MLNIILNRTNINHSLHPVETQDRLSQYVTWDNRYRYEHNRYELYNCNSTDALELIDFRETVTSEYWEYHKGLDSLHD